MGQSNVGSMVTHLRCVGGSKRYVLEQARFRRHHRKAVVCNNVHRRDDIDGGLRIALSTLEEANTGQSRGLTGACSRGRGSRLTLAGRGVCFRSSFVEPQSMLPPLQERAGFSRWKKIQSHALR